MIVLAARLAADPPLDPSPDDARSALRRELARPDYYDDDLLDRFSRWLGRLLDGGVEGAGGSSALTTLAIMVLVLALLAFLGLLVSRARFTARDRSGDGDVLTGEGVTAGELRRRAEAALAEGRHHDAVVDGFRALALRQVERGRLDDSPGVTAHEVAGLLAREFPDRSDPIHDGADLFDAVLYGERPATREQAAAVLALDGDLARAR